MELIKKIKEAETNAHKIIEIKSFEHEESHLPVHELVSDAQGRSTSAITFGSDTMDERTSIRTKEAVKFADQIVDFIEDGFKKGECERLYVVAKAPFLGHLREALSPGLHKIVAAEVSKDLTQLSPEQVREYLPPVL